MALSQGHILTCRINTCERTAAACTCNLTAYRLKGCLPDEAGHEHCPCHSQQDVIESRDSLMAVRHSCHFAVSSLSSCAAITILVSHMHIQVLHENSGATCCTAPGLCSDLSHIQSSPKQKIHNERHHQVVGQDVGKADIWGRRTKPPQEDPNRLQNKKCSIQ